MSNLFNFFWQFVFENHLSDLIDLWKITSLWCTRYHPIHITHYKPLPTIRITSFSYTKPEFLLFLGGKEKKKKKVFFPLNPFFSLFIALTLFRNRQENLISRFKFPSRNGRRDLNVYSHQFPQQKILVLKNIAFSALFLFFLFNNWLAEKKKRFSNIFACLFLASRSEWTFLLAQ